MISEIAYAKINLTLSVGEKRSDGYHNIDSVMHSISLADTITLEKAPAISLSITCGNAPKGKENLMVQAAELFFEKTGLSGGVALTLEKRIPSEAGMGGGSSDAAAVLRGLHRLYEANVSRETLAAWSASLGADIPFCVLGGAARCQGIGDILSPLAPWPHLPLVIVRPPVSVSTGKAYGALDKRQVQSQDTTVLCIQAMEERNREALAVSLQNDFEIGLFPLAPMLQETSTYLKSLHRPCLMTGSGSAFFLLAADVQEQERLYNIIKAAHSDWFVSKARTVDHTYIV